MQKIALWRPLTAIAIATVLLSACGGNQAPTSASMPPPEVGVVTVAPTPVPITQELPGRVEASRVAEVRARAAGIVQSREFQEGSEVEAGDVLFRIEPAPLSAALNSARAQLARAGATLKQAPIH